MNYDITNPQFPKMTILNKGAECIKILLKQVSKDVQEFILQMSLPILGPHSSNGQLQNSDPSGQKTYGLMANYGLFRNLFLRHRVCIFIIIIILLTTCGLSMFFQNNQIFQSERRKLTDGTKRAHKTRRWLISLTLYAICVPSATNLYPLNPSRMTSVSYSNAGSPGCVVQADRQRWPVEDREAKSAKCRT